MAVDSTGPEGQPRFDGTKAGNTAADMNAVSDYAASRTADDVWGPQLGGNGASLGNNPGYSGTWVAIGDKHARLSGRFVFGSGASFGTGSPTILGLPIGIDSTLTTGYGHFINGSVRYPIVLTPGDGGLHIRTPAANGNGPTPAQPAWALGTPPQSSQLVFTIDAVRG